MKRTTINFIVDLASFLVLLVLSVSGIILALPHKHGPNETRPMGLGRGQLGDIHLWLGITFIVLMLVHLVLHWGWITCYLKSLFGTSEKPPCEEKSSS